MQLFFNQNLNEASETISFDKEESRHVYRVLRKKPGDILNITNGKGLIFKAELMEVDQKSVLAKIVSSYEQPALGYNLHMAVAPTKSIDRFEWFLEKATEIGITEITPIICDQSERKILKKERLERIILSAMKQSLKAHKPKLNDLVSFDDFLNANPSGHRYIAHCADGPKYSLFKEAQPSDSLLILIGPEGDFSVKEIERALNVGFIPVTLGSTRLRTETAALAACHTIALINE